MDEKQKEKLASSILKNIIETTSEEFDKPKKNISLNLSQNKGKPLKILAKPANERNKQISVHDMQKIQVKYNLSSEVTLGVATDIRISTNNRNIIETGLKESLVDRAHRLDPFFDVKKITVENSKKKVITTSEQSIVYCSNLDEFVSKINAERNSHNVEYVIGIDGGGGFLKFCLTIKALDKDDIPILCKRRKFEDGICNDKFRDTGVKKLFIIALARATQENYSNI